MESIEGTQLCELVRRLDVANKMKTESVIPVCDEFCSGFFAIAQIECSKKEKSSQFYDLYEKTLVKYEETLSERLLLESGVALFNSIARLQEEDDSVELQKFRLKEVLELTENGVVSDLKKDFLILRLKALLQETMIFVSKDHNFDKALLKLEEIIKLAKPEDLLHGKLWNIFVVNALQVYQQMGETKKYEALISEIIVDFEGISCYVRWDIIIQLIRAGRFTEEHFKLLARAQVDYFYTWIESEKSGSFMDKSIKSCYSRVRKLLLIERLTALSMDMKRDKYTYNQLKNGFKFEYKDLQGRELIAGIKKEKGLADNNPELVLKGISQYQELEKELPGMKFYTAKAKIDYHLKFSDFTKEGEQKRAKGDLFDSLNIIEQSIGERPIEIFTKMLGHPYFNEIYYEDRVLGVISSEEEEFILDDREEVESILEKIRQSKSLKNVALLILLLYGEKGLSPLEILKKALDDQYKNYIDRTTATMSWLFEDGDEDVIRGNIAKYFDIEITQLDLAEISEHPTKPEEVLANKVKNMKGTGYETYQIEEEEEVINFKGFKCVDQIFVLKEKGKPLMGHTVDFIKMKLSGDNERN